jgi:hypothetical protein
MPANALNDWTGTNQTRDIAVMTNQTSQHHRSVHSFRRSALDSSAMGSVVEVDTAHLSSTSIPNFFQTMTVPRSSTMSSESSQTSTDPKPGLLDEDDDDLAKPHMSLLDTADPMQLYDFCELLGEGAYGSVWRAKHKGTGDNVAIKVVTMDDDDKDLTPLLREIEILQQCDSAFIVSFFGAYRREATIWIAMELCEAGSASDLMEVCDLTYSEAQIKEMCASVVLALEYFHGQRLLHCDVKAGNILLTQDGRAKLADFGVSAQLAAGETKRWTTIGTRKWGLNATVATAENWAFAFTWRRRLNGTNAIQRLDSCLQPQICVEYVLCVCLCCLLPRARLLAT